MSSLPTERVTVTYVEVAKNAWVWAIVRGAVAIGFGIVAMLAPIGTAVVLATLVAIFAIIDGVVDLVDAIRHRGSGSVGLRATLGAISLVFGLIVLFWPEKSISALVILIALWAVVIGVLQIMTNLKIRKEASGVWGWGVATGALGVILGLVVIFWPHIGIVTLIWLIAIWALIFGIAQIVLGVQIRKVGKALDA